MDYKTLYESIWQIKKNKQVLTLLELDATVRVQDVHLLTTMLLPLFEDEDDEHFQYKKPVSLNDSLDYLQTFKEKELVFIRLMGQHRQQAFDTFKAQFDNYMFEEGKFQTSENEDQLSFYMIQFEKIDEKLKSLSNMDVHVNAVTLKDFVYYYKGKHVSETSTYPVLFDLIEMKPIKGITKAGLSLANILLKVKETNLDSFKTLVSIQASTFVQSLLDAQNKEKRRFRRTTVGPDNIKDVVDTCVLVTEQLETEIYQDHKLEFVRDFLL